MSTVTISPEVVEQSEGVIRDIAATVVSMAQTRKAHPSFGYTKTEIRNMAERLEGMVQMYGVLTGQRPFPFAVTPIIFANLETHDRYLAARRSLDSL